MTSCVGSPSTGDGIWPLHCGPITTLVGPCGGDAIMGDDGLGKQDRE